MPAVEWAEVVVAIGAFCASILAVWAGLKGQERLRQPATGDRTRAPSAARALKAILSRDDVPDLMPLRPEQVATLLRGLGFTLGTSVFNAIITTAIMWDEVDTKLMQVWLVAIGSFLAFGLHGWARTRNRPMPASVSKRTIRRIAVQATLHGLIWGAGFVFFYADTDSVGRALLIALSLGIAAGGIASLSAIPAAAIGFSGAILIPTILRLVTMGESHLGLAMLYVGFTGVMGMSVGQAFDTFARNVLAQLSQKRTAETVAFLLNTYEAQAADWLWSADRGGRLKAPPDRMLSLLGRPAGEAGGLAWADIRPPGDAEGWDALQRHLDQGTPFRDLVVALDAGGKRLWLSLSGRLSGEDGNWSGVGSDVTEREDALRALQSALGAAEAANRAKSAFLASMSHELRTPLNAIIGFSEVMSSMELPKAKQDEYIRDIHQAGKHLLGIVNDILDIARLEAGAEELRIESVDVNTIIRESGQMVQPLAERGGLTLDLPNDKERTVVEGDSRAIRQIVLNLLGNAIKFTPAGGRIDVRIRALPDHVDIQVTDTGIGIDGMDLDRVLQPFVQSEGTLARRFEGTGLGLPIAVRLTELHGGRLTLESEPGKGTTACIRLPRAATAANAEKRRAA